jgi:hypothetical protein
MDSFSAAIAAAEPPAPRTPRSTVIAGLIAFVPVVCALAAFAGFASFLVDVTHVSAEEAELLSGGPMRGAPAGLSASVLLFGACAATSLAAFAYFLCDAMVSAHVAQDTRAVWAVVLLFGNVVAFPVYWYVAWWCRRAR